MTPESMAELVARWVRFYTRNLPASTARRRIDEIDADVHDHVEHERGRGTPERRIALSVVSRMARGLAADLTWRAGHARQDGGHSRTVGDRVRGLAMGPSRAAAMTMSIVAGVIGLVWLFSGFLFAPAPRNPHPLAILVWLAFGGGVALVSRWAARPAVLGAAALLSVVAVVDLFVPLLHAGGGPVGLISSSEYTWIAIAILAANGALPERSSSRSSRGDANTPAPR